MADSPNYYDNIPNAEPEHSLLNSFLDDYFQHKNFKNKTQRNAIVKILKRESDVIVSLPKGHGRTTCFQLPIVLCQKKVSIVFVGLQSRVNMQINRLNREHVYVEIIDAGTSSEKLDHIKNNINNLSNIRSSLNSMLYVTPDVVSNVYFLNLLHHLIETNSLGFIVIDIAYCENDWLSGQTEDYYALRILRNILMDITWVVTTEKASYEIADFIKSTLFLKTQRPDIPRDSIPWFAMNIEDNDVLVDR
ncbi:hypothetical protein QTP88_028390 [Uroleucon formosanum]